MAKDKKLEKSMEIGANMEGMKPNIKQVKLNSPNDNTYTPKVTLGRKRIDWGKKGGTPTGKGSSGSAHTVGSFGAAIEKIEWSHTPDEYFPDAAKKKGGGHPTSTPIQKEDGGGALDSGAGTVFTSTNAGIFTPTHGDSGPPKKVKEKKKRSGIEKLGAFLTDGSPEKKMRKKTTVLKTWVEKQEEEKLPKFVETDGGNDTSNRIVAEQLDMEDKIKMLNDEEKNKDDDNFPTTDVVSAHITDVQLSKQPQAFGNPQDDELKRGSKKDKSRPDHEADLELAYQLPESVQKEFDILNEQHQKQQDEFFYNLLWKEDESEIPIKKAVPVYNGPPSAKYLMRL